MAHAWTWWTANYRWDRMLLWVGLLASSAVLAWTMNVGLIGLLNSPDDYLSTNSAPPPLVEGTPSEVLEIIVIGPDGSHVVRCLAARDRPSYDLAHVAPDELMRVFHQVCVPQLD